MPVLSNRSAGLLPIVGVVALIAGLTLFLFFRFVAALPRDVSRQGPAGLLESADPLVTKVPVKPRPATPTIRETDFVLGSPTSPVTIFEFSDFSCPYCRTAAAQLRAALRQRPEVRLVWKDFPVTVLHPDAVGAHVAARCAGAQGKFWEYHDQLFQDQGKFSQAYFVGLARTLNLKTGEFTSCLEDPGILRTIQENVEEGDALGVSGTPDFFIGDQHLSGLLSDEELEQVITFQRQLQSP